MQRGLAIRRELGIGDCDLARPAQGLGDVSGWIRGAMRPKHERADGIGEPAAGGRQAGLGQTGGRRGVGRQKGIEGRTRRDLGIEFAGGSGDDHDIMAACRVECLGQGSGQGGEVAGHRDARRFGAGRPAEQQGQKNQG